MSDSTLKNIAIDETVARNLINSLALLLKTAQIHNINNIAVTNVIHKFLSFLNPMLTSDKITLELAGEFFYINENRVRYSMEYIFNFDFLSREFKRRRLGTIIFHDLLTEEDTKALVDAFIKSINSEDPFQTLTERLEGLPNIDIKELQKIKEDYTETDKKKFVKRTYSNAILITKDVLHRIKAGERIDLKRAKRLIGTVVDQIVEDESLLIGMTTIKDYDEYTYYHSVNVSILSVALGHRLGLSRKNLSLLGLAALFHDIGKVDIPIEVLNKPSEFTEEEWRIVKRHPIRGLLILMRLKQIDDPSIYLCLPTFEHHLNYDLSGYPKIKSKIELDFFSKIIAIADQYDAMTSARVYSRKPMSPETALSTMVERSGKHIAPSLLKVFINMIGTYPIGSLVMLDTNELGLVFENNPNPDFIDRPRVLIISNTSGERIEGMVVDLMEKDMDGNFKKTIVKTLDPNKYGINLAEYIL